MSNRPLILHLTYILDFGGLETLMVECINRMPANCYRHAIVCLTKYTEFSKKITKPGRRNLIALHKGAGLGIGTHVEMLEAAAPASTAILHTRNLAALEARCRGRRHSCRSVHGEHGRDASTSMEQIRKYNLLRRPPGPLCRTSLPESGLRNLAAAGHPRADAQVAPDHNGVDGAKFIRARARGRSLPMPESIVFGSVGRMVEVKDPHALRRAFHPACPSAARACRARAAGHRRRGPGTRYLPGPAAGRRPCDLAWLPGERDDIADIMQVLDVFVLPSKNEGISDTILEAMASGLPVIATAVGGNVELVERASTACWFSRAIWAAWHRPCSVIWTPRPALQNTVRMLGTDRATLQHSGHGRGLRHGV